MTSKTGAPAPLPPRASLEHLKKQAKQLLHAARSGIAEALQTIRRLHPKPGNFFGLRDAQLVVARQYGYQDWQHLVRDVELQQLRQASLQEQADQFVRLACLRYDGDDRAWRNANANALLAAVPALPDVNPYCAIVAGKLDAVRRHLDRQPVLATQDGGPLNWPPLMYLTYSRVLSTKQDVLGIVQLLLAHGADPDSHVMFDGQYRFSALTGAMGEGERGPADCPPHQFADALVDALLEAGASPNEFQGLYDTMFTDSADHWLPKLIAHGLNAQHRTDAARPDSETTFDFMLSNAIGPARIKRVWILLEAGANPNAVSRYNGRSAHTNAVLAHQPDIAAALLQHGARVEKLSADDEFRVACWHDDLQRADALLQQKPALAKDPQVFSDVARTRNNLLDWLLAHGFDVNSQTADGRSVLHRVAAGNELDEVRALIAHGANPNLKEHHYGATPLGFALHNRAWDVAHYLRDFSDELLDVVRMCDVSGVRRLLEQRPERVRDRTPMGNTPLHLVGQAFDGAIDIDAARAVIQLLIAHGADPQATNAEGLTPLQFHEKMGSDDVAGLFAALETSAP
ncbi:MAG: ankyrin repeat domain-containing protein [Gammaproteobacteria bacterium]